MKHTSTTVLTPDQLYKVAKIFSNATTADVKLANYAANKTVDFMEAGIEDGSMSLEAYNALKEVSEAVPSLKQKMDNAYEGKKARKEREEAREVQALRWQAEREARNCQRAVAKRTFKSKKAKKWEELQEATEGLRPISLDLAKQLMTGPVVFKGEIAKAI